MADTLCRVEFPDLAKRIAELERLDEAQVDELAKTAYEEVELIMTESKELVPVDTGALRASGHVQLPQKSSAGISVEFGFGGPAGAGNVGETNREDVGYAVWVHENLTAHHDDGEAKYLEKPVNQHQNDLDAALVGALDTAAKKTISK